MTAKSNRHYSVAIASACGVACVVAGAAVRPAAAESLADWASISGLQIGGSAIVGPKYEGSKSLRVLGVPFVVPAAAESDSRRVDFKGLDDIRLRLVRAEGFEAGPLAGWRFGRDEEDGKRLWGLGDVDGGLVVGAYAAYRFGVFKPFLSYHHQVTGDHTGGVLRLGSDAIFELQRGIRITATAGMSYAGDDYMQHYFSVTPGQAAVSVARLAAFDASSGIKDVYIGLQGAVPLSEQWTFRFGAKYTRLVGDAADSPVVETADQFSGSLGLSYRLGWGR